MTRWLSQTDEAELALALGLECAQCGRFSGPNPRGWTTCPLPEDELEPVLFFCPGCAKHRDD